MISIKASIGNRDLDAPLMIDKVSEAPNDIIPGDGLSDYDVLNDTTSTGIGEFMGTARSSTHRHQSSSVSGLDDFRRLPRQQQVDSQLCSLINQAIDEVIAEHPDCYADGWEADPEFVRITVDLVLSAFDFDESIVENVIMQRRRIN